MGDLREPSGAVLEDSPVPSSSSSSSFAPEVWTRAELATQKIIRQVQPTVASEDRRRDVIDYVQRLLRTCLGCEVFPFGSVPLKTYLPDGDIDLTAFCGFNIEEGFANDVYSMLEAEDRNPLAVFVVKDVQYIRAEVKLVKCLVQNIVVDISFNQIGGLCALCFLEEVDRLIGKDHLFKRSIILIKAWCYYESRILGAHHGLISTYALETLVLYIFHLFHSSLNGPLAVLYKFLDYFSKFDWESYCVSLSGPVPLSSLPEIVAEKPENGGGDLLLTDDFIGECVQKFSVPSRGTDTRTFMQKHLNIVDPLKENNNLGRSVSKGNFFRIRSAFSFGARKLGQILLQPQENIAEEVRRFFTNTLERHGQGRRPDVQDFLPMSGCNGFVPEMLVSGADPCQEESYAHEEESVHSSDRSTEHRVGSEETRHLVSNVCQPASCFEGVGAEEQRGVKKSISSSTSSTAELPKDETSASPSCLSGDASDLATCGVRNLRITSQADKYPPIVEERKMPLGNVPPHASHLYFSHPLKNGTIENGNLGEQSTELGMRDHKLLIGQHHTPLEQENNHLFNDRDVVTSIDSNLHHSSLNADARYLQDSHSVYWNICSAGNDETQKILPDLSGDVDGHLGSLQYGRLWYDQALNMSIQPVHLHPPPFFQRKNAWDAIRQPMHFRQDIVPHMNVNGVVPRPAFFPINPQVMPGTAFGVDEMPKTRGTGTYFPITNHHSYRDRSCQGKGRTHGQLRSPRTNGRVQTPLDRSPQAQSPVRQGSGKLRSSDSYESSPRGKLFKEVNGLVHPFEKPDEFGSLGHLQVEPPLPERENSRPPDSGSPPRCENGQPMFVLNDDRLAVQSYRLKDDGDFPPLSV